MDLRALLLVVLLLPLTTQAKTCWDAAENGEIMGFAELDGKIILSFKDAVTCQPVRNAKVTMGPIERTTDGMGYATLPAAPFADIKDMQIPVRVEQRDYIALDGVVQVRLGSIWNPRFVMSKRMGPGKVRLVLQWDDRPADLDLHVKGPGFHVSYQNKHNVPNKAKLDRDDRDGFGPETITLDKIVVGASYAVYVDQFSREGAIDEGAQLQVYVDDRLEKSVRLAAVGDRAAHIVNLSQNGVEVVNQGMRSVPR